MAKLDLPHREQDALSQFAAELRRVYGARLTRVRLFGSAARGEYGPDSDLDVSVVVDGLSYDDIGQISLLASQASLEHDVLVSPLPMSTDHFNMLLETEQRLARDILSEGIAL